MRKKEGGSVRSGQINAQREREGERERERERCKGYLESAVDVYSS